MDQLWKGPKFQDHQFEGFRYFDKESQLNKPERFDLSTSTPWPSATIIQYSPTEAQSGYRRTQAKLIESDEAWEASLAETPAFDDLPGIPSSSIILLPALPTERPLHHNPAKLRSLPMSEATFRALVQKFHIHQALHIILARGVQSIFRIRYSMIVSNGQSIPCISFILRTPFALPPDHALCITHFPTQNRLYAVFLGCSFEDTRTIHKRLEFAGLAVLQPFTLISTFLEVEKKLRFQAVTEYNYKVHALFGNWSSETLKLFAMYKDIVFLRDQLEGWKSEILGFREYMGDDFPGEMLDPFDKEKRLPLLEAREYLDRLIREYDSKSRMCEEMLGAAGLQFQFYTAASARGETQKMKVISVVTLVFLPATFVSTFLSMGVFNWQAATNPTDLDQNPPSEPPKILTPLWWIFFPLSGGLTVIVLFFYIYITRGYSPLSRIWMQFIHKASSLLPTRQKAERSRV